MQQVSHQVCFDGVIKITIVLRANRKRNMSESSVNDLGDVIDLNGDLIFLFMSFVSNF